MNPLENAGLSTKCIVSLKPNHYCGDSQWARIRAKGKHYVPSVPISFWAVVWLPRLCASKRNRQEAQAQQHPPPTRPRWMVVANKYSFSSIQCTAHCSSSEKPANHESPDAPMSVFNSGCNQGQRMSAAGRWRIPKRRQLPPPTVIQKQKNSPYNGEERNPPTPFQRERQVATISFPQSFTSTLDFATNSSAPGPSF